MVEWFSVKEKLPEDDRNVLVYDDNDDELYIAWYEEYNNRWYSQESERLYGVTHWMPLPEPPKGE